MRNSSDDCCALRLSGEQPRDEREIDERLQDASVAGDFQIRACALRVVSSHRMNAPTV